MSQPSLSTGTAPASAHRPVAPKRRARGMTLFELLLSMGIFGTILSIGLPSALAMRQSARLSERVEGLASDLRMARREAANRGQPVTVCASDDGQRCEATRTWHRGWIVFVDSNNDRQFGEGDTLLHRQAAWDAGDSLVADSERGSVTYRRDGFAVGLPTAGLTLAAHGTRSGGSTVKCLSLNFIGRQSMERPGFGRCA